MDICGKASRIKASLLAMAALSVLAAVPANAIASPLVAGEPVPADEARFQRVVDISSGYHAVDDDGDDVDGALCRYQGQPSEPISSVVDSSENPLPREAYGVRYLNNASAPASISANGIDAITSSAVAIVTGNADAGYTGSFVVRFNLGRYSLQPGSDVSVAEIPEQDAYEAPACPHVTVSAPDGTVFAEGVDYTLTYSDNTFGSASGTVTVAAVSGPSGKCAGSRDISFPIALPGDLSRAEIAPIPASPFDGRPLAPLPEVTLDGRRLVHGTDYEVSYSGNDRPGTATLTVSGKGRCAGSSKTATFEILAPAGALDGASVSPIPRQRYTGGEIRPAVEVRLRDGAVLPEKCYEASYSGNVDAGTATVEVAGKGAYAGGAPLVATFEIAPADLSQASARAGAARVPYAGGAPLEPGAVVEMDGRRLSEGRDYAVSYRSNKAVGRGYVVVEGRGNYTGCARAAFEVTRCPMSRTDVAKISPRYTTSTTRVKPAPRVTIGGKSLVRGRDYTVKYRNNKNPGTAKAVITGKGSYTGRKTVSFELVNLGDDLAREACRLSYSRGVCAHEGGWENYPGTDEYLAAHRRLIGNPRVGQKGRACHKGMMVALRSAGWVKRFGGSAKSDMRRHPGRWVCLGTYSSKTAKKLRPGDIVEGGSWHTCMYVGTRIQREVYAAEIRGSGKDGGDLGMPRGGWVSAHHANGPSSSGSAALCMCTKKWSLAGAWKGQMKIYRCVKPQKGSYRAGKPAA